MQDFTVSPAVVSRSRLVSIIKEVVKTNELVKSNPGRTPVACGVSSLEEFCEVLVGCAIAYARSSESSKVAEGIGMLVERMEASH